MIDRQGLDSATNHSRGGGGRDRQLKGTITPFPGGIVASGSKVGSKYKFLKASTNTAYCPSLREDGTCTLPEEVKGGRAEDRRVKRICGCPDPDADRGNLHRRIPQPFYNWATQAAAILLPH